jgi:hypothetical protein
MPIKEHRGYHVSVLSREDRRGQWRASWSVVRISESGARAPEPRWLPVGFDSLSDADEAGFREACAYIDSQVGR